MTPSILGWMFIRQRSRLAVLDSAGKLRDGIDPGNESGNDSAIYSRTARQFARDLGRRNLRGVVARSAEAACHEVLVCDPRKNALLKAGNKNDRIDARKLADLLYRTALAGLSRRNGSADSEGTGPQLPGIDPRYHAGDEPPKSPV